MTLSRAPHPVLRPLIERIWATAPCRESRYAPWQAVLPTGQCHLAIRTGGAPFRIYEIGTRVDPTTKSVGVVGGPRSRRYIKAIAQTGQSVGALLRPGATLPLFGVPAGTLAESHTPLEDVWGADARWLFDALDSCDGPQNRLFLFEDFLLRRLGSRPHGLHPAIAEALNRLSPAARIATVRSVSGLSRKQFDSMFRDAVGLTPKRYQRLIRFRTALSRLSRDPGADLADVAYDTGFADQAHFQHEFRDITGMTPDRYRRLGSASAYHLPFHD